MKSIMLAISMAVTSLFPACFEPAQKSQTGETSKQAPSPSKKSAGERARENSELLSEMLRVILNDPKFDNKKEFGEFVLTLNQGASLEGIYRGIIMGTQYRALESNSQAASPTELKAFAVEMVDLQESMKNPSIFTAEESKKTPNIEFPDGNLESKGVKGALPSSRIKKTNTEARDELLRIFIGSSSFTLKRLLGEEALKKLDEVKDNSGELAKWYADFVVRFSNHNIDFGLELRNKPDFDLHFKFAQTMSLDRVKWEVLNRYHRYLNHQIAGSSF